MRIHALRPLILLAGFFGNMVSLMLVQVSLASFAIVQIAILIVVNYIFLRWFSFSSVLGTVTLLSYDVLVLLVVAIAAIALSSDNQMLADALLAIVPIPAVIYPLAQGLFFKMQKDP